MKRLILLIAITSLLLPLVSQTMLTDTIMADSTLRKAFSPYVIQDSFHLYDTATLTLEAGVVIKFGNTDTFAFSGNIMALGSLTDSVTFELGIRDSLQLGFLGSGSNEFHFSSFHFFNINTPSHLRNKTTYIDTSGTYLFEHSSFLGSPNSSFSDFHFEIHKAKTTFKHSTFKHVRIRLNDAGAISSTPSLFRQRSQPAEFESCLFESMYMKTRLGVITHSHFKKSYVQVQGAGKFEQCIFENNRMLMEPDSLAEMPIPPVRYDTFFLRYNQYFATDTSRRYGILGMSHAMAGGGTGPPTEASLYPALRLNYNDICVPGTIYMDSLYPGWDISNNCWCETDTQAILGRFPQQKVFISFKQVTAQDLLPFNTNCIAEVYPGDTDSDLIANMRDLLPIGLQFGNTGPVRANASLNWVGQPADSWSTESPKNLNDRHADCNGDGIVNANDTLAILQNYTFTHQAFKASGNGIPLTVRPSLPANSYKRGDTVTYIIEWGDLDSTVQNAYGATLSLQYDTSQWKSSSLDILFPNSWLGNPGTDMLTMVYHDSVQGRLDIGWTRTDGISRSGFGEIGSIVIVLDDDISKRQVPVSWDVLDAYAITQLQEEIFLDPEVETLFVDTETSILSTPEIAFRIYPNPSTDGVFHINMEQSAEGEIAVYDMMGKRVLTQKVQAGERRYSINLNRQTPGMYTVVYTSGEAKLVKRVVKGM